MPLDGPPGLEAAVLWGDLVGYEGAHGEWLPVERRRPDDDQGAD